MSINSINAFTQQVMNHVNRQLVSATGQEQKKDGEFIKTLQAVQSAVTKAPAKEKAGKTLADYRLSAITELPRRQKSAAIASDLKKEALSTLVTVDQTPSSRQAGLKTLQAQSPEKKRIEKAIAEASGQYDVSAGLIRAVIQAESNFNPRAVSKAGAKGLMQLMPATAKELGVKDSFNIEQNISGGTKYLRRMLDLFGGDTEMALAAYNAGPGTVIRNGGRVPYRETVAYVDKVMTYKSRAEVA